MSADETTGSGRDWTRLLLLGFVVLATVVAALLVPMLATDDIAGTPIDSILPGERFDDVGDDAGGGGGGVGGGFGALHPGDRTGVGGETGFDDETFGANDTDVHFYVESSHSAYWRTGAYDTYTGTGWERDGDTRRYPGGTIQTEGLTSERAEFEVRLAKPATAIPTVWQPTSVSGVDNLVVTEKGAVRTTDIVDAGTRITGVSHRQENSVPVLRAAGDDYPDEIEQRYTQLPASTPERVSSLTADLIEDDDTTYDEAMTVQNWLRSEKGYSLEASERSDTIADTFIFEMEEGYCEYFATAMTTMLRTQGIPARYTVGYSTGQPVDDNTYEVRGMNAHAWVEVYFPDVGWVKFDPTPGGSRLASQSDVLDDELDEDVSLEEYGSPGERFEPGEIHDIEDLEDDEESSDVDDGYGISLNRTAVPGMAVEVEVTYDGDTVPNAAVFFNGDRIGTTDLDGTVVGTVPDDETLEITVSGREEFVDVQPDVELGDSWNESDDGRNSGIRAGGGFGIDGVATSLDTSTVLHSPGAGSFERPDVEANATFPVVTDATVTVSGDVWPAESVTVTATVDDVAIPDADVFVDGARITRTGDDGRADVPLPGEPGNATITIERGAVTGTTTVTIPELELGVDTGTVTLPFTKATVDVTAGDRTVADAPIYVDGQRITTTGADGTATVRLPLSTSTTIETNTYGMSDRRTIDGLVHNLVIVSGVLALVVAVPLVAVRRSERRLTDTLRGIRAALSGTLRDAQIGLLWIVHRWDEWLQSVAAQFRTASVYLWGVLRGRLGVADVFAALNAWIRLRYRSVHDTLAVESDDHEFTHETDGSQDLREAWNVFLGHVSVTRPETRTPGELAAHAIEQDGLPAESVRTLRDAFREVEYGSRPVDGRRSRIEEAIDAIESHRTDEQLAEGRGHSDTGRTIYRGDE